MPNSNIEKWEEKTLGDICTIGAGNSAPQNKELFNNGIYPFFRTADVGKIHFGKIYSSTDLLNDNGIKGLKLFKKGTILIPKSGASTFLNHRVKMEVDGFVVSHLATVKGNNEIINDDFLLYYLSTVKVQDLIQDQNYPSVNLPIISGIKIKIPSLTEQQRIVGILDEAFENIEKAKQNTLQNLNNAKELFESSFEELLTKNTDYWNETKLFDICEKVSNRKISKDENEKFLYVDIASIDNKENKIIEHKEYNGLNAPSRARQIIKTDDVVFSTVRTYLKNIAYVTEKYNNQIASTGFCVIRTNKDKLLGKFIFYKALTKTFLEPLNELQTGANYPAIRDSDVFNSVIKYPTLNEQQKIVQQLDELQEKTKKLEQIYTQKLQDLDELKQSLLQKAFNGEL